MRIFHLKGGILYKALLQVAAVSLLALAIWWLGRNLIDNLNETGIPTDFDFLTEPTDFRISNNRGFSPQLPFWRALLIGIQNTVLAGVVGIFLATILGVIIGIARLSSNWLVAKTSQIYIETFRNIPVLAIIVFFSFAIFLFGPLPAFADAYALKLPFLDENFFLFSREGVGMPSFRASGNTVLWWWLVLAGFFGAAAVFIYRTWHHIKTGIDHHRWLWSLGVFLAVAAVAYVIADNPYRWSFPEVSENGRLLLGGFGASASYLSLTLALAVYTSSHIAEITRGSILSVPKGQSEAAYSLNSFQRYRFVVLPQAFRVSVPPTVNQYLNLMKNTSLGIAVAYPEVASLTNIGIGNQNPGPQSILIMMGIYLTLSLIISSIGNSYNKVFLSKDLARAR